MASAMLEQMSEEQLFLIRQSMEHMDRHYDESMGLLRNSKDGELTKHSTRGSSHYAVGLLLRGEPGDLERACRVMERVLDMQFVCPGEIYEGTFRTSPQAEHPPAGNYPWRELGQGHAYFLATTRDKISASFLDLAIGNPKTGIPTDADRSAIRETLEAAFDRVLPPVWKSYDPNWREFIACSFAVILELFEDVLPKALVARIDRAMRLAVEGSIARRLSDAIPMNTNIELMHMFICDYFGSRFGDAGWLAHTDREASAFLESFREFGSFAEFNTTTYYGVDLTVLGLIRQYGKTASTTAMGREVEQGLWRNIALFYNANLENMSGPFSRAYEMEMLGHSSVGVFVYLALGRGYEHLAGINCESGHDPIIALAGVDVPEDVLPVLKAHSGDRFVEKRFRELCERDKPGDNRNLCKATAWIESRRMIGAMSGSRNTNGQMHPATIHWMTEIGDNYYLRLLRRLPGESWNSHLRGIVFEAAASEEGLEIDVRLRTDGDVEVYFEITGPDVEASVIEESGWRLPGLELSVSADAPTPTVVRGKGLAEIVYPHRAGQDGLSEGHMSFELKMLPD